MATNKLISRYRRSARDFALGLGVFATAGLADLASPGCFFSTAAHARRFEEEPLSLAIGQSPDAMTAFHTLTRGGSGGHQLMVIATLAVAFATMFALNLWFARHVRRVHVSARRRG
jgi:hypothetical protein